MRALPLILMLAACGEESLDEATFADALVDDDGAAALPDDQVAPPITLSYLGPCPGPATVSISGLTPGGQYRIARSPNLAPGVPITSGPCAGVTALRIGPPATPIYTGTAPPSGMVTFTPTLGAGWCGDYLQILDIGSCTTSNFIQIL